MSSRFLLLFKEKKFSVVISEFEKKPINHENWQDAFIYAMCLFEVKKIEESMSVLLHINQIRDHHEIKFNISQILKSQYKYKESIKYLEEAVQLFDKSARYFNELGSAYLECHQYEFAINNFDNSLKLTNDNKILSVILYNKGLAYFRLGDIDNATTFFQESIIKNENFPNPWVELGVCFKLKGDKKKAIDYWLKIIKTHPKFPGSYNAYSVLLIEQGKIMKAMNIILDCLKFSPNNIFALNNLALCQTSLRLYEDASRSYLKAFNLDKRSLFALSNYLLSLNYNENLDEKFIISEHKKFSSFFGSPSLNFYTIKYNKETPINIAYVSGDFNRHSVMEFFIPIIKNYNRKNFKIFCFSNNKIEDDYTIFIKNNSNFIEIFNKSDEEVIKIINQENIHILVDLSGHTRNNRLTLFAKKPCPVQITWIGYATTTGISSMDYRFVDNFTDPEGNSEIYAEERIRLDESFLCFDPPAEYLIEPPPNIKNNYTTYGSFNNFNKVTDSNLRSWATILSENYNNKLILKDKKFNDPEYVNSIIEKFKKLNINHRQLVFYHKLTKEEHFLLYNKIDIALDTFPYNGTTTTLETLWMGVPLITLYGASHQSRVSSSILSNLNLFELCSSSQDDYINKAISLSKNKNLIYELKKSLRQKLKTSIFLNHSKFVSNLEDQFTNLIRLHFN